MDISGFLEAVQTGGLVTLLLIITFGAIREWWVPGPSYRRALRQADYWRQLAVRGTSLAESAVRLANGEPEKEPRA